MKRAQADRRIVAARVKAATGNRPAGDRSIPAGPVSRNLLARGDVLPKMTGPVRRSAPVRYSGSGTDGYRSDWSRPGEFFTDPRWSATVSNPHIGPALAKK